MTKQNFKQATPSATLLLLATISLLLIGTPAAHTSENHDAPPAAAKLDDSTWKASASIDYYPNGNIFLSQDKPCLIINLYTASAEEDSVSMMITVTDFKPQPGNFADTMKVQLTSNPKDIFAGYQHDLPEQKTDFTFEITDWESTSETSAQLSAKFSGTLRGILGKKDVLVTDGVIQKARVRVNLEN